MFGQQTKTLATVINAAGGHGLQHLDGSGQHEGMTTYAYGRKIGWRRLRF